MPHDVFVSYSSRDQATALAVVNGLESAGIRCWIAPRDIMAGDVWAEAIVNAITGSRALVLLFSSHANRSGHVINEVDAAIRKGAIVIPFRIENVMPDGAMEYHLRTRHWLDAITPDVGRHIAELVSTVKSLLGQPAAPPPQTEFGKAVEPKPSKPRPVFESTESGIHLKLPPIAKTGKLRKLGIGAVVLAVLAGFGYFRFGPNREVAGTEFEVREATAGSEFRTTITARSIRFFEGPRTPPQFGNRKYGNAFASAQTRYVYTEVGLHLEAPGRFLSVPISCTIFGSEGGVKGTFTLAFGIPANGTDWVNASGWGADQAGTWKTGRYRVECRYGTSLITRGHFDILG